MRHFFRSIFATFDNIFGDNSWRTRGLILVGCLIGGMLLAFGLNWLLPPPSSNPPGALTGPPSPGSNRPLPSNPANPPVSATGQPISAPTQFSGYSPPPPLPTPIPPTPLPVVKPDPRHGIHAPIGAQWTDPQRQAFSSFKNKVGQPGPPGTVLALSSDLKARNNVKATRMEQDLNEYARQGSEIYVRMYPQRFPGGFSEAVETSGGVNTISGSPADAAEDIFKLLDHQQRSFGWHFTRIIPGNEPDLEWPNQLYAQNLLPWVGIGDPIKYSVINRFYIELYQAWQRRVQQPDAAALHDVMLYFPALAQDATPDSVNFYASFNFYQGSGPDQRPVGNRYDRLREAVELYRRFSWHNYFQPGRACQDVTADALPDWLKRGLEDEGWPSVISEAGWSPGKFALPTQSDSRAFLVRFWQALGVKWERKLYQDERLHYRTADEVIDGARFEDDLQLFIGGCYQGGLKLSQPPGIAVWLAGSEGNFIEAIGVEPGPNGTIRRWLRAYAAMGL